MSGRLGRARRSLAPRYAPALSAVDRDRRYGGGLLAGALAFRLFGALLPLALLAAVALGYAGTLDPDAPGAAAETVGIRGALLESVAESSKLKAGTRWAAAGFAMFALLWSAISAARAVRAAHGLAWEGGVRRFARPLPSGIGLLGALLAICAVWAAAAKARGELGCGGLVITVAAVAGFFAIWLAVSLALPHGGAPWSALVPGALLVAVGLQVVHLGTVLLLADWVERASATYGSLGAAGSLLLWLYIVSRVIVGSAMLNAALWERRVAAARAGPARAA